jgi:potassium voltage-gated channel KQT-like subfamily protein
MYSEMELEDNDDTTENTALLRTAAKTEIIVTPISPVSGAYNKPFS